MYGRFLISNRPAPVFLRVLIQMVGVGLIFLKYYLEKAH